ncbi:Uncharacterized protein HZ326_7272 [Fusarium oxysporum f. sp. albedinis]|nr:Uncharacterized protein HZ326_7272 [Fusarium oxysporum f. sp. albedinis]
MSEWRTGPLLRRVQGRHSCADKLQTGQGRAEEVVRLRAYSFTKAWPLISVDNLFKNSQARSIWRRIETFAIKQLT